MNCGARWHAVIPTGTAIVECPQCGSMRGHRTGIVVPSDAEPTFRCLICEDDQGETNELFIILPSGFFCAGCGQRFSWDQLSDG